ncbi:hypothetical protein APV28_5032 [Comamonas testosteroni]|nr:hypothetical protein APV28_5032 [Comamonas testosteroni]
MKNKADDDWTVRLGARLKGNFATGAGVLQPYGRINVYKASNTTDIKAKGGYTATEMAAGASLQINPRTASMVSWASCGPMAATAGSRAGCSLYWREGAVVELATSLVP